MRNIGNRNYFGSHEPYGNRELKYYKDIYGNNVRLMTTKEKNIVNKVLIISSIFIVVLVSGLFYKAYLVNKEIEERTKLYLMSGDSIDDGQSIVRDGGVIVSEDSDVVLVEDDGTIVAQNSGSTNVTVYKNIDKNDFSSKESLVKDADNLYEKYNNVGVEGEFTFEVVVNQKADDVLLGISNVNMYVGETNRIYANVLPHTSSVKDVLWSSSNNSVATIDNKGVISARGVGTATITVTTKDGLFKDTTVVHVSKKPSENNIYLSLGSDKVYVGDHVSLVTVVSPNEELKSKLVYSSSDSSVLSINSNGQILAKKKGTSVITARIASEEISSSIEVDVVDREVENIYLSSTNLSLRVSDTYNLVASFFPVDAVGNVTYSSNNSKVASVNSDGKIEAHSEGVAVITVKSSNGVISNCYVEVKDDLVLSTDISVSLLKDSIIVGEKTEVYSVIMPDDTTNKNVTYTSSDSNIAKIVDGNKIVGVKAGDVVITGVTANGVSNSVSLRVNDGNVKVEKIVLDEIVFVEAGKSILIKSSILPSNATNKNIIWSSEDNSIAKVDSRGVLTGVSGGNTVITAKIDDVVSNVVVNVVEVKAEKIVLNYEQVDLFMGESIDLKYSVFPSNVTNKNIIWSSSDESIVKVDKDGEVKAVGQGDAIVTATSSDSLVYSECIFNVSKVDVEYFKLSHEQVIISEGEQTKISISNIQPKEASFKSVNYELSDNSVASINDGVITGLKPGFATITVIVDDIKKEIDLTVLEKGDKIYFIDTYSLNNNPSDAILLNSNGKYALIDTGSTVSSINTIKFLKELGVKKLEFILITHFHSESFGGIYGENPTNNILLSDIEVGKVYIKSYSGSDSYFLDNNDNVIKDRNLIKNRRKQRLNMYVDIRDNVIKSGSSYTLVNSKNSHLSLGNFDLDLYNVDDQLKKYSSTCLNKYNCSEDSNSIVTHVKVNGKNLYLASDIFNAYNSDNTKYLKTKTEEEMASLIGVKNIDIYKASNYGYNLSNVEGALKYIKPIYSVVTNSYDLLNSRDSAISLLEEYTKENIYYSGDGSVIANINDEGNISFIQLENK